jgi:hypothetical protein
MKKYVRLSCTVCKRATDKLVDDAHYSPDKCTITLKCEGRLFPVQYRSNGEIVSTPVTGVTDWQKRITDVNPKKSSTTTSALTFVNTACGTKKQIVLALQLPAEPAEGSTFKIKVNERSDTPKSYRQYVYRIEGSFSSISGVEAGLEKKTLRYALTDTVDVFLNGVKLANGLGAADFQLYNGSGSNGVPSNTVNFNTPVALPGVTQVDVIVSPAVSTSQVELTFNRAAVVESRAGTGAWENVSYVSAFNGTAWQDFYLFYLDLADAGLKMNTILTVEPSGVLNGTTPVSSSAIKLLLAHAPYSQVDRHTNLSVPLDTLNFDTQYLKYFVENKVTVLYVTQNSLSPSYPPMVVTKFKVEKTIQVAVPGVTDQVVVDGSVIVGPDA